MSVKTRHCVPADDSTSMNMVVPKTMKERIASFKGRNETVSCVARKCMMIGLAKMERDAARMAAKENETGEATHE